MNQKTDKLIKFQAIVLAMVFAALAALLILPAPAAVSAQSAPPPTAAGSTFEQRLAQRKAERKVALDQKTQKRLESVCAGAQNKVRALQQTTTPAINNRNQVYSQMDAKLWVIIGKLKLAEKDTFNLEKQRAAFAKRTSNFQATAKLYQQTLDDITVINCQADPAGFKALIDTALLYRVDLRKQTKDINDYVVNEIKTTLSSFASELQAKPSTEGEN